MKKQGRSSFLKKRNKKLLSFLFRVSSLRAALRGAAILLLPTCERLPVVAPNQKGKSFLLLFFKKEDLPLLPYRGEPNGRSQ
jgi:hypothetical protein